MFDYNFDTSLERVFFHTLVDNRSPQIVSHDLLKFRVPSSLGVLEVGTRVLTWCLDTPAYLCNSSLEESSRSLDNTVSSVKKKKDGPWENKSASVLIKFFEYNRCTQLNYLSTHSNQVGSCMMYMTHDTVIRHEHDTSGGMRHAHDA